MGRSPHPHPGPRSPAGSQPGGSSGLLAIKWLRGVSPRDLRWGCKVSALLPPHVPEGPSDGPASGVGTGSPPCSGFLLVWPGGPRASGWRGFQAPRGRGVGGETAWGGFPPAHPHPPGRVAVGSPPPVTCFPSSRGRPPVRPRPPQVIGHRLTLPRKAWLLGTKRGALGGHGEVHLTWPHLVFKASHIPSCLSCPALPGASATTSVKWGWKNAHLGPRSPGLLGNPPVAPRPPHGDLQAVLLPTPNPVLPRAGRASPLSPLLGVLAPARLTGTQ